MSQTPTEFRRWRAARSDRQPLAVAVVCALLWTVICLWPGTAAAAPPQWLAPGAGIQVPIAPELAAPPPGAGATLPVPPSSTPAPAPTAEPALAPTTERGELELETPTLQSKRTIPPFWLKREYDTHTTTALTFPPLYIHREPSADHPEKLFHFDLSFTIAYYAKKRGRSAG